MPCEKRRYEGDVTTQRIHPTGPARPQSRRPRSESGDLLRGLAAGLRRAISTHGFAIAAMLLQVLFTADHLGATLAPGARIGLLQICTGEGVVWMTPEGRPVPAPGGTPADGTSHSSCPVCASSSVCSFDTPEAAVLPHFVADLGAPSEPSLSEPARPVARRLAAHAIRAPPAA